MIQLHDFDVVSWLEPWGLLRAQQRPALERELARELSAGHALWGCVCVAIAARGDRDDVLFLVDNARLAITHLDWTTEADPRWPSTTFTADVEAFVVQMKKDHDAFVE